MATMSEIPTVREEQSAVTIFLQYETLPLSDFTEILNHLSRAYDLLSSRRLTIDTSPYTVVLTDPPEPLRIEKVETGNSITVLCMGAAPVVVALAHAFHKALEARKVHWEGEKAKWEAKEAEKRFKSTPEVPSKNQRKAIKQVRELVDSVEDTAEITRFRLALGNVLTIEHTKRKDSERVVP
jgi:tRNA A37 threonylcarbamoyladenosine synthetase subunit TsaC/SUA5/YrdC